MFAVQRSPGHFFDTAPFALSLWFAVCLAALARRAAPWPLGRALPAAVLAALVLDYWPSTRSFASGDPLDLLRGSTWLVADLPSDGGMLRIGLGPRPEYSPLSSWVLAHSQAGHAWGWIFWQAGKYWGEGYALAALGDAAPDGAPASGNRYEALLDAARVRYALISSSEPAPGGAWRRIRGDARYGLWERPGVAPRAQGYREWMLWTGDDLNSAAHAAAAALRANALLVALPPEPAAAQALRAGASAVLASAPAEPLLATPAPAPIEVEFRRGEPERIEMEIDAGAEPALVFVSEGYHPWWRALVDGRPAPVLRAAIAHMAVHVTPGHHEVELRLVRPAVIAAADGISAAAWLTLVLGAPVLLALRRAD